MVYYLSGSFTINEYTAVFNVSKVSKFTILNKNTALVSSLNVSGFTINNYYVLATDLLYHYWITTDYCMSLFHTCFHYNEPLIRWTIGRNEIKLEMSVATRTPLSLSLCLSVSVSLSLCLSVSLSLSWCILTVAGPQNWNACEFSVLSSSPVIL